uniref:Pentatricopeptide repeat-containing protein n=1 Tax=Chenopodium quinoa TaxID=63459 RepID=A0A803KMX2_CHEQI
MSEAAQLLSKMDEDGCLPDDCTYIIIIRGYIFNNDLSNALYYRDIMVREGFGVDADTFSLFVSILPSGNLCDSSKDQL